MGSRTVNPWSYLIEGQRAALAQIRAEEVASVIAAICGHREDVPGVDAQVCSDQFEYLGRASELPLRRSLLSLE